METGIPTSPPATSPDPAVLAALGLHRAGKLREAESAYRAILAREPGNADALHLLGQLAHECGHHGDGEALMRKSIALLPGVADFHNNLGALLQRTGRAAEAAPEFRRAVQLRPDFPEAWNNLGAALEAMGDCDAGAEAYAKALELRPEYAGAGANLTAALEWLGRPAEATAWRRKLVELRPDDPQIHSDLLTGLHYHAGDEPELMLAEHLEWARRHEAPLRHLRKRHENDRSAQRPLRVGYVSPDLRSHPVVRFFAPLLAGHDRTRFTVYCYSNNGQNDVVTERLRERSDGWRDIRGMDDDAAAELICRDQIDILVDLCGHMPGGRLLLFARKPAPVQVTCIGYPGTTGLEAMDWRLTDADHDPLDCARGGPPCGTDRFHTEKLARVEGGLWCYQPDEVGPGVSSLPSASGEPFTFGLLNRLVKVTPQMARLWAQILRQVPNSRLLILAGGRGDLQASTRRVFAGADGGAGGFPWERVLTVGRRPRSEYLRLFHKIDLGLDTYPYAGQTTTCDALWMGVPTVALAGRTHVARTGVGILKSVGLEQFIAHTPEQYVRIAVEAAADLPRLAALRAGLRERMERSPLRDPVRLVRGVEKLYRQMWEQWCEGGADSR